jgi:type VI protein secretion system component VasF
LEVDRLADQLTFAAEDKQNLLAEKKKQYEKLDSERAEQVCVVFLFVLFCLFCLFCLFVCLCVFCSRINVHQQKVASLESKLTELAGRCENVALFFYMY